MFFLQLVYNFTVLLAHSLYTSSMHVNVEGIASKLITSLSWHAGMTMLLPAHPILHVTFDYCESTYMYMYIRGKSEREQGYRNCSAKKQKQNKLQVQYVRCV